MCVLKIENRNGHTLKNRTPASAMAALFKISEAVSNTRNLDELYRVIHISLGEVLNVDNFYIGFLNETEDMLYFPYYVDETGKTLEAVRNFSKTETSIGRVIKEKKPMMFLKDDIICVSEMNRKGSGKRRGKIWLGAPLIINKRVNGAIVLQSYSAESDYEAEDLELLNSISRHIALAIERKEFEEKLKEQGSILGKILEASPVGIALVENRVFTWVNNELVKMLGYSSKSELKNQSTRIVYQTSKDYENTGHTIYKSLTSDTTADYEANLVRKDNTVFPAHVRLNCRDASDPMSWTIATFTDISLRKAAEMETFEKERLQGVLEMAGAVCHEINQPLQAILGYSELLLMGLQSEQAEENRLNAIKNQASRLGRITHKLSRITRYRTVEYPGNTKIVDIWGASGETEH